MQFVLYPWLQFKVGVVNSKQRKEKSWNLNGRNVILKKGIKDYMLVVMWLQKGTCSLNEQMSNSNFDFIVFNERTQFLCNFLNGIIEQCFMICPHGTSGHFLISPPTSIMSTYYPIASVDIAMEDSSYFLIQEPDY